MALFSYVVLKDLMMLLELKAPQCWGKQLREWCMPTKLLSFKLQHT